MCNRQWPQLRLHQAVHKGRRLEESPYCQFCARDLKATGADGIEIALPAGTFGHRVFGCQILPPWRDRVLPPHVQ